MDKTTKSFLRIAFPIIQGMIIAGIYWGYTGDKDSWVYPIIFIPSIVFAGIMGILNIGDV